MAELTGNNYLRFSGIDWSFTPDAVYCSTHAPDRRYDNPFDSPSVQRTLGIARSGEPKYVYQDGEVRLLTAISSRCSYCGVLHGDDMRFCDRCGAPR